VEGVTGTVDGSLLAAVAPNLPLNCRFLARIDIDTLVVGGKQQEASGHLRTSPVHCTTKLLSTAGAVDLPALKGAFSPVHGLSSGALYTIPSHQSFVEARLSSSGAFSLWPTGALITRVPALSGIRYDIVPRE
jgi:hypothetical protein